MGAVNQYLYALAYASEELRYDREIIDYGLGVKND